MTPDALSSRAADEAEGAPENRMIEVRGSVPPGRGGDVARQLEQGFQGFVAPKGWA